MIIISSLLVWSTLLLVVLGLPKSVDSFWNINTRNNPTTTRPKGVGVIGLGLGLGLGWKHNKPTSAAGWAGGDSTLSFEYRPSIPVLHQVPASRRWCRTASTTTTTTSTHRSSSRLWLVSKTSASSSSSSSSDDDDGADKPSLLAAARSNTYSITNNNISKSRILAAALWIAGITVGGGFLALPTVVAPNGFYPSATALVGVWAFFAAQSLVVVEALCQTNANANANHANAQRRNKQKGASSSAESNNKDDDDTDDDDDSDDDDDTAEFPGMAAAAKFAFGTWGERLVVGLLVMVVEATLVSQISRAGAMVADFSSSSSSSSSSLFYRAGCALTALSMAAVVFGPYDSTTNNGKREEVTTALNSALTIVFLSMAVLLFAKGLPAADWTRLSAVQNWKTVPASVPTFLQLLVYGEILPTICHYLHYQVRPIRWAIGIGSLLPLILEVGWAALGIGLSPSSSSSSTSSSMMTMVEDPVALLLAAGPIKVPLLCLALSAILTTILGSYLALNSTLDDVFFGRRTRKKNSSSTTAASTTAEVLGDDDDDDSSKSSSKKNAERKRRRLGSAAWITLPALAIASISPSLFLQAIDFAGSYPVLLLWGIAPPAIVLRLRRKLSSTTAPTDTAKNSQVVVPNSKNNRDQGLPAWWIKTLLVVSLGLFGMSAAPDVSNLGRLMIKFIQGIL